MTNSDAVPGPYAVTERNASPKNAGPYLPPPSSQPQSGLSVKPSAWTVVISILGSMKFAVVLLVVLGLLTWLGTLAQIEDGLWKTQKRYFESWGLIAELPLSFWGELKLVGDDGRAFAIKIPLPGAYLVMVLLFINLLVGGMLRLRWHARNIGVLIVHIGIALLLIAGFVKLEHSFSGALALYETPKSGQADSQRVYESSVFVSFHECELALLIDDGEWIEERVIPESELMGARTGSILLRAEGVPFEIRMHHFLENCRALPKGPNQSVGTPIIDPDDGGPGVYLQALKPQAEQGANNAGAYLTVLVDGKPFKQDIVFGADYRPFDRNRYPFSFELDGVRYGLDLRKVVSDLPYALRLEKFVKRDHPGTAMAADYRSTVSILDGGQEREAQIFMNTPLRKDGYVVYQTNWGPQRSADGSPGRPPWYSVFEVAYNPSDQWPMYSCWVIGAGIFIHMILKLMRFMQSSARTSFST